MKPVMKALTFGLVLPQLLAAALLPAPNIAAADVSAAGNKRAQVERRAKLDNGLRLVLSQQDSVPIVAIKCLVDGGARVDPAIHPGLAGFTGALLDEGTPGRNSQEIAKLADSLGGSFSAGASTDWMEINAVFLARDFEQALDLVAQSLAAPTFPEEEVERIRKQILGGLKASEDEPGWVASRAFDAALFGDAAYGHPIAGNPESIKALRREDLVAFHGREMTPSRTICAIVGDIETTTMEASARRQLGAWQPTNAPAQVEARTATKAPPAGTVVVDRPLEQANVILGQTGIARNDPDYFPLVVMNHILGGGGFTSRLTESVRTREGLAYSVYSRFDASRLPGPFQVVLQTKVASASKAIALVRQEIGSMHAKGAKAEELAAAQDYLTGNFPLHLDSTAKLADLFARLEYFELGADYLTQYPERIRAVSIADVARVARRHLKPESLVTAVVGPASRLAEQGIVDESGSDQTP